MVTYLLLLTCIRPPALMIHAKHVVPTPLSAPGRRRRRQILGLRQGDVCDRPSRAHLADSLDACALVSRLGQNLYEVWLQHGTVTARVHEAGSRGGLHEKIPTSIDARHEWYDHDVHTEA